MKNERRNRFVAFFTTRFNGDRAKFMRATGLTKGRVTQLLDTDEPFGELAANRLAMKLKLPPDYFERDHAPGDPVAPVAAALPPKDQEWLDLVHDLPPHRAEARLKALRDEVKEFRDYAASILGKRQPFQPAIKDEADSTDNFAGGRSNFGELDEAKDKPQKRKPNR